MTMSRFKKEYIHYIIALVIGIVLGLVLQPTNGLTVVGIRVVAILVPVLYLWLTTNTHWTSLLALALLIMTTAMTPNEVWAGSMGHFVVITVVTYMLLNVCLKETGVINKIAFWFVSRKIVQGRPYVFMAMFFASNVIIGLFMDNLSLAVIYIGIAEVLCKQMGLKKGDSFYTYLYWCCVGNVLLSHLFPDRTCASEHHHGSCREPAWYYNHIPAVACSWYSVRSSYVRSNHAWMPYLESGYICIQKL